ncbi:MAG: hypothetical protein VX084_12840, partial [Planctomycetota bacterium]|nr:hypothetical protein [Planctomycetota bacterium]
MRLSYFASWPYFFACGLGQRIPKLVAHRLSHFLQTLYNFRVLSGDILGFASIGYEVKKLKLALLLGISA